MTREQRPNRKPEAGCGPELDLRKPDPIPHLPPLTAIHHVRPPRDDTQSGGQSGGPTTA